VVMSTFCTAPGERCRTAQLTQGAVLSAVSWALCSTQAYWCSSAAMFFHGSSAKLAASWSLCLGCCNKRLCCMVWCVYFVRQRQPVGCHCDPCK
jgi:hypothetical protein